MLDMEDDKNTTFILGRLFLAIGALIDVQRGELCLRVQDKEVTFNIFKAIKHPCESDDCFRVDAMNNIVAESFKAEHSKEPLKACIIHSKFSKAEATECATSYVLGNLP
ncbi:LOW QUALITY PROTEIN: hypothetical protein PanWU01x14_194620 [Parasponia andersonii]|uniref:Uncharacterized protein n=1 Tax=Parasponia andersonii TaxID=3476 RepID=A0A2P5C0A2_PARAD|nr:LOW QUALITY PROTEIN: hypothetical protein PanWU01x14_194620 [Parasponia andersonii]